MIILVAIVTFCLLVAFELGKLKKKNNNDSQKIDEVINND